MDTKLKAELESMGIAVVDAVPAESGRNSDSRNPGPALLAPAVQEKLESEGYRQCRATGIVLKIEYFNKGKSSCKPISNLESHVSQLRVKGLAFDPDDDATIDRMPDWVREAARKVFKAFPADEARAAAYAKRLADAVAASTAGEDEDAAEEAA